MTLVTQNLVCWYEDLIRNEIRSLIEGKGEWVWMPRMACISRDNSQDFWLTSLRSYLTELCLFNVASIFDTKQYSTSRINQLKTHVLDCCRKRYFRKLVVYCTSLKANVKSYWPNELSLSCITSVGALSIYLTPLMESRFSLKLVGRFISSTSNFVLVLRAACWRAHELWIGRVFVDNQQILDCFKRKLLLKTS